MTASDDFGSHLRQAAWRSFLTAQAKLVRDIDADLTAAGMFPLDWYDVLLAVGEAPGRRLRLSELADRVLVSRSGITRLTDRIEAKGLLARERCADDRRGAFAVLTDAGAAELRRMLPAYHRLIDQHFGRHMDDAEAMAVHRVCSRIAPLPKALEPVQVSVSVPAPGGRAPARGRTRPQPPAE